MRLAELVAYTRVVVMTLECRVCTLDFLFYGWTGVMDQAKWDAVSFSLFEICPEDGQQSISISKMLGVESLLKMVMRRWLQLQMFCPEATLKALRKEHNTFVATSNLVTNWTASPFC